MDTSETWGLLKGAVKIFEAGLQSQTWDIHGMPTFNTTTHCEGWNMCKAYALHIVEMSRAPTVEIPSREVKKAFWISWPNIVCQIEDEVSSESNKKVEWYSDHHDNLMDDIRLAEEKASNKASTSVPVDKQMPMMLASASSPAVGPQATPLTVHLPTSKITPPWGRVTPWFQ